MTKTLPAERPLPHRQEILERILADESAPVRRTRTWLIPVGAAASIALVAGGLLFVTKNDQKTQPDPAATPSPGTSAASTAAPSTPTTRRAAPTLPDVHINVGRLTAAEAAAAANTCADAMKGDNTATKIGHALKVMTVDRGEPSITVAFTSEPRGLRYGCAGDGKAMTQALVGGDPAVAARDKAVINSPDARHPAVPSEGMAWFPFVDFDQKPDLLLGEGWYRVDNRVASMRQRWTVRGKPGPWYVAEAADGLVFVRSWDQSAVLKVGEQVRVETQVLDQDGRLLDAPGSLKGGGGLTPSPGTTRVDIGTVVRYPGGQLGDLRFTR
jgi:hypothetical protein